MGQAIGTLEYMMKNLGASIGYVEHIEAEHAQGFIPNEDQADVLPEHTKDQLMVNPQKTLDMEAEREIVDMESEITGDDCSEELEILEEMMGNE
jgi:hypothetical protein